MIRMTPFFIVISIIVLFIDNVVAGFVSSSGLAARKKNIVSRKLGTNANELYPLKEGSTPALITPFTPNGSIDVPCLERLLQYHLDQGTDNLCILGTTSEAAVLTMKERELILKTVVTMVKGEIPILVGTGTINPNIVKSMTQQAIDLGADANLVVSPYYVKPPQRCLIKHFTTIADMGLPVIMYNVPGRTKIDVSDDTIVQCAQHESIVGLKDATGDLSRLATLKQAMRLSLNAPYKHIDNYSNFLMYSGNDSTTLDYILAGGDGAISVTANLVPEIMHHMIFEALHGDHDIAKKLNEPLMDLHEKLFIESNPIPTKWAAKRLGLINSAFCRKPLAEMDPKYEHVIERALQKACLPGVHSFQ